MNILLFTVILIVMTNRSEIILGGALWLALWQILVTSHQCYLCLYTSVWWHLMGINQSPHGKDLPPGHSGSWYICVCHQSPKVLVEEDMPCVFIFSSPLSYWQQKNVKVLKRAKMLLNIFRNETTVFVFALYLESLCVGMRIDSSSLDLPFPFIQLCSPVLFHL